MKKELFAISSLALSCLALSACNTLDQIEREFTSGSENAQVEDATSNQKTAGRKSAAQRAPSSTKALEVKTKATGSDIKLDAHDETLAASSGNEKVTEAIDADEEVALRNTAVDEDGDLLPLDQETVAEISKLPDYATTSGRQTCPVSYGTSAKAAASALTTELLQKLTSDHGNIFIAPTVIPEEYSDCIDNVASEVKKAAAQSKNFTPVADDTVSSVAQNSGSSTLIPATVRECRRRDIPYLAVSVVRISGGSPVLTVRIIRVATGVTLTQSYKKLN